MATFADDTAVMAAGETVEGSTRKLQSAVNKVAIWTRKLRKNSTNPNRYILTSQTTRLNNNQFSSMAQKFHMPTQQNILV
jgi:ABC-type dipeptide/oligopeptide/nickel transport system ATPase component